MDGEEATRSRRLTFLPSRRCLCPVQGTSRPAHLPRPSQLQLMRVQTRTRCGATLPTLGPKITLKPIPLRCLCDNKYCGYRQNMKHALPGAVMEAQSSSSEGASRIEDRWCQVATNQSRVSSNDRLDDNERVCELERPQRSPHGRPHRSCWWGGRPQVFVQSCEELSSEGRSGGRSKHRA